MGGYIKIFKFLKLYLIAAPIFLIWFFLEMRDESLELSDLKDMFLTWLAIYIFWASLFIIVFGFYSLFLLCHKISFEISQFINKIKKSLKIKRKKIWKYPIIIQYDPPKELSVNEISYLYSMNHFKWNISWLFYKRAYEKRISMTFKEWGSISSNKVEINIIDDSLENMPYEEKQQWKLIFSEGKVLTLPSISLLRKISAINAYTAHLCYEKKLIEKSASITITPKMMQYFFFTLWASSIIFLIYYAYAYCFLDKFQNVPWRIPAMCAALWVLMIFWTMAADSFFEKTKLIHYTLSEKWKQLLAEIYWYKYFLEACDEKKMKTFLKQDPEYLDKILPYAITIWVETDIIKKIAPKILDWTNTNRHTWSLYSTAKTLLLSSERTILLSAETAWKRYTKKSTKSTNTKKKKNN